MTELLHKAITGTIIGVYYDVYNGLARSYPEYVYEKAMMGDLQAKGMRCRRQPEYEVTYKEQPVGGQRLDLFVAEDVVVELKVAPELTRLHKAQAISYLKVTGSQVALLCNFGSAAPQFERLYYDGREAQGAVEAPAAEWPSDLLEPQWTHAVIGALYEVHNVLGPGFIYRIYANALYHELQRRGLEVQPLRVYEVIYRGRPVGAIKFEHLLVEGSVMVFPVAIQDSDEVSIINLKAWMQEQRVPLGIVANFYPASLEFMVLRS